MKLFAALALAAAALCAKAAPAAANAGTGDPTLDSLPSAAESLAKAGYFPYGLKAEVSVGGDGSAGTLRIPAPPEGYYIVYAASRHGYGHWPVLVKDRDQWTSERVDESGGKFAWCYPGYGDLEFYLCPDRAIDGVVGKCRSMGPGTPRRQATVPTRPRPTLETHPLAFSIPADGLWSPSQAYGDYPEGTEYPVYRRLSSPLAPGAESVSAQPIRAFVPEPPGTMRADLHLPRPDHVPGSVQGGGGVNPTVGEIVEQHRSEVTSSTTPTGGDNTVPLPVVDSSTAVGPSATRVVSKADALAWVQSVDLGDAPLTKSQFLERIRLAKGLSLDAAVDMGDGVSYRAGDLLQTAAAKLPDSGTFSPEEARAALAKVAGGDFGGATAPAPIVSNDFAKQWTQDAFGKLPATADTPEKIQAFLSGRIPPGALVTINDRDYDARTLLDGFTAISRQYGLPPGTELAFIQTALGGGSQ